ncbi:MAG TPA: hypothetical protein DD670_02370, partial [Planctomycetaceae bacterium]|nr:hypothetical protein [Planctomycetaceae bacterium]
TIDHEDPSDLFVYLISPNGTEIQLFGQVPRQGDQDGVGAPGTGNGANFTGTILDDEAGQSILVGLPPFDEIFVPEQALAAFDGQNAQGTWFLRIEDRDPPNDPDEYDVIDINGNVVNQAHDPDGGRLWGWALEFTRSAAASLETLVNTTVEGNQLYSSVDMDSAGNFTVAWCGYGSQPREQDTSEYGVFYQRFDVGVNKVGGETRVNQTTKGMQWLPSVGVDANNNAVVVWTGESATPDSYDVFFSVEYPLLADLAGPIVTDVLVPGVGGSLTPLFEGGVASVGLDGLVIVFDEELSEMETVAGGVRAPAIESILNPNNWILEQNGSEIHRGVGSVEFEYNNVTHRYEAVITFDGNGLASGVPGLSAGGYVLTIRDLVRDTDGNKLDGERDGIAGTSSDSTGYSGYKFEFVVPQAEDALGAERRVNQSVSEVQVLSEPKGTGYAREVTTMSVAVDHDGDYVVVWTSYGKDDPNDPNGTGVYARLYNRNDVPLTSEFLVNRLVEGNQGNAAVAMDADGDFIVVWESEASDGTLDVYSQRFTATGERVLNSRDQRIDQDPYRNRTGSEIINGVIVPIEQIETLVNTTTVGEQFNPAVAMDSYGNYIVVWGTAGQNFSYFNNVLAQRFDFRGEAMGDEFRVNVDDLPGVNGPERVDSFLVNPSVAIHDNGNVAVTWDQAVLGTSGVVTDSNVLARLFDADNNPALDVDGAPLGDIQVNTGEVISPDSTHDVLDEAAGGNDFARNARNPQVAMDNSGAFIVVYEAYQDHDLGGTDAPDSYGIYYRQFDEFGAPRIDEAQQANTVVTADENIPLTDQVTQYLDQDQVNPTIGMDADGDFVIFWNGNGCEPDPLDTLNTELVGDTDDAGVFGRWFHAATAGTNSAPTTTQQRANETESGIQQFPSVAMTPDGDVVLVWAGAGVGDRHGIFVRRYEQSADNAGPNATELRLADGNKALVGPGDNIFGNPTTLLVVFDEQLNTANTGVGGSEGLNSVENVNNWALINGSGEEVSTSIHHVTFYFDATLNKWVAAVTFSGPNGIQGALGNGTYTLVARSAIHDAAGNALARTGYQPYGTGRQYDAAGNEIPLDPITSPTGGFGFQFTVNNTYPGDPSANDLDQLVGGTSTIVGQDNLAQIDYQDGPDVARNAHGDYVVVWVEYTEVVDATNIPLDPNVDPATLPILVADPAFEANIVAQRFHSDGREWGERILVNTLTIGVQTEPAVAIDDAGNFVVVWSGDGFDLGDETGVFGQRFDADGMKLGGQFRISQFTTSGIYGVNTEQDEPAVAMNPNNGDFVVSWTSFGQDGSQDGVYARMYRANGSAQGDEFLVNKTTTVGAQGNSGVAMDGLGNFVVTWQSEHDINGVGVYAQRFDSAGARRGTEVRVNTYRTGDQDSPAVAMDRQGNFVIVWASSQDGSGYGVYGQIYKADGTTVGGEFLVNETVIHDQFQPDVAMTSTVVEDEDFGFVVTWTSFNQDSLPDETNHRDYCICARMYNSDGTDFIHPGVGPTPVGEFRVNAETVGDQYGSAVSMDANGHYVVVWAGVSTSVDTFVLPPPDATDQTPIPTTIQMPAIYSRYIDPPVQEGASSTTSTELVLTGTSGNDVFEFVGGPVPGAWIVKLNGVVQSVPSTTATVRFDGLGGADTVVFTGSAADDSVELWPTRGVLSSIDYTVTVENVESITASGGGGNDAALLHDSAGDDTFTGRKAQTGLTGAGFSLAANAFETVEVRSEAGGYDQATLYDAAGDDAFTASHQSAALTDGDYTIVAKSFDNVKAFATAGGLDTVNFADSPGNDRFESTAGYVQLRDDQSTYYLYAEGFDGMVVASTAGGADTAKMYGSAGNDTFKADRTYAQFQGDGFYCRADGFSFVLAYGQGGTDTAQLYDSAGDDTFVAGPNYGALSGDGYKIQVDSFRYVTGYGSQGNDLAVLYDSAGDDTLLTAQNYAQLSSNAYSNRAHGFRQVNVFGREENGGYDQAVLYDSAMADHLDAADNWLRLSNDQFNYWACCFESVVAKSMQGGDDTKDVASELDFVLAMEGNWRDR